MSGSDALNLETWREEFLTIAQFAKEAKVHKNTVRKWIDSGLIRVTKIGNTVRLKRRWGYAALEANEVADPDTQRIRQRLCELDAVRS